MDLRIIQTLGHSSWPAGPLNVCTCFWRRDSEAKELPNFGSLQHRKKEKKCCSIPHEAPKETDKETDVLIMHRVGEALSL